MAIYEYSCPECRIIWECDFPFGKPEKKTPCPKCEAKHGQHYAGKDVPIHFKGAGWSGVNKQTGFNKTGGSDEVNIRLQDQCKDRMDTGWQHYARFTPPQEYLDKARKLSPKEVQQKLEVTKKMSDHNYDKAGIDPHNKYKPQ